MRFLDIAVDPQEGSQSRGRCVSPDLHDIALPQERREDKYKIVEGKGEANVDDHRIADDLEPSLMMRLRIECIRELGWV